MAREYFCAYHSYLAAIEPLDDEERGRLFTALLIYSHTGDAPELTGNERFVFPTMRDQIDRDLKKYQAKCERNRINGAKGGKANATERKRTPPKEKEKTKEKEKAKEKEKEKENIKGVPGGTPADKPPRPRFTPPDESSIVAYFRELGSNREQAEAFRDYYDANGWKVGKNSMRDWKAAARSWLRRAEQYTPAKKAEQASTAWDNLDKAAERIEQGDFSFLR